MPISPQDNRGAYHDEDHYEPSKAIRSGYWKSWSSRVVFALAALLFVVLVGGVSIWISGEGEYSLGQSIYFSLITVSTVGYGELPHLKTHPWARTVSATTIVGGLIVLSLFQSTLTALFVEGVVGRAVRKRRMNKAISKLKDHFILVGCGRVGRYVAEELHRMGQPFVVIEQNPDAVHHLEQELHDEVLFIDGNAADDEILQEAGIDRAMGMATTLSLDRDNLFVTLSARTMNPQLRIVAKVVNSQNEGKFLRAGATSTISPQSIGGRRLAHELLRPQAVGFLDNMMQVPKGIGFHDILINHGAFLVGKDLRAARLRDAYHLLVVGFVREDETYDYNPPGDAVIEAGWHLIVLGAPEDAQKLKKDLAGSL